MGGAFHLKVEEAVKRFLEEDLYKQYDDVFVNIAIQERKLSWKDLERQQKAGKKDKEVPPPEDPGFGDPEQLFADGYSDKGPDGIPQQQHGEPLDKKAKARLKADYTK